jgi:hypothetical protein
MWKRIEIRHSMTGRIHLYARDSDGGVEVAIAGVDKKGRSTWFEHDRLLGSLADLALDQRGTPISWEDTEPPTITNPAGNMFELRARNGQQDGIEFLRYHIANAVNASQRDRAFGRWAKQLLVGTWTSLGMSISFNSDGMYGSVRIDAGLPISGAPPAGRWYISSNMLWLMGGDDRGIRCQLVDISPTVMVLPGDGRALRYVLERSTG